MSNEKKISLHLRGDNLKNIKQAAAKQDRSPNQIINIAVEEYLNKQNYELRTKS